MRSVVEFSPENVWVRHVVLYCLEYSSGWVSSERMCDVDLPDGVRADLVPAMCEEVLLDKWKGYRIWMLMVDGVCTGWW